MGDKVSGDGVVAGGVEGAEVVRGCCGQPALRKILHAPIEYFSLTGTTFFSNIQLGDEDAVKIKIFSTSTSRIKTKQDTQGVIRSAMSLIVRTKGISVASAVT